MVVVGAGPAGVAAAIAAHRGGRDVMVIDKAGFPRDKCCGDGLTTLALRELEELGVSPDRFATWETVQDVALRTPRGRQLELKLPRDRGIFSAVVRRNDLDHQLVEYARELGIEVREHTAFAEIDHDLRSGTVELEMDDGSGITTRHVVAADGMWSPVRRALGRTLPDYRGDWHALRQYRTSDGPRSRQLWVWFEPDLLPGYAWSFPLPDGRVNFGFGIVRGDKLSGKQLNEVWRGLAERPHIAEVLGNGEPEGPHRAWPIPARLPEACLFHGRVMFVGDAAAVTDPMTGEGIGQALETGRLAGEVLGEGGPAGAMGRRYEQLVRSSLQTDHRFAHRLSGVLARPRLAESALRAVDLNQWTRRNFARWMFEDYPRATLLTPRRWRRGVLSRPGAFAGT